MDHIWSPWRFQFITEGAPTDQCVLCRIAAETDKDDRNFVVYRGRDNFIVLNLYPYTAGHMMVVPYRHEKSLAALPTDAAAEMMGLTAEAERALTAVYHPAGINLGMNLGAAAGAGIAGHIHMHVLPRWPGDANFLSTIGETRMIPEELPVTWTKLRASFQSPRLDRS